jgi:O-antigen ligase
MNPSIAAAGFAIGIAGLFLLERDEDDRTSLALWLPILWLSLGGSRNISNWFGAPINVESPDQYLDGSPLDRNILSLLIGASFLVVAMRGRRTLDVLRANAPLVIFFLYCAASAAWSDYPFVTLKHWTKAFGNVTMVLVVLTDAKPVAALKRLVSRTAFILVPASVLVIKYFPDLGRHYDRWEGKVFYVGAAGDKNMLGCTCLILGIGLLWRLVGEFKEPVRKPRKIFALAVVFITNAWVLRMANSATSLGCLIVGSALILFLSLFKRARPMLVHSILGGMAAVGVLAYLVRDAFALIVESLGRNTTLTGRTDLWPDLLSMDKHPWFGEGFESFFLGDRLTLLWTKYWWHPTEAHNGYLDFYLTLGIVGVFLVLVLMITGYRHAVNVYRDDPWAGSLRLAFVLIAPIYNITEAAFKVMNPLWICFLLAATAIPRAQEQEERQTERPEKRAVDEQPARGAYGRPVSGWERARQSPGYARPTPGFRQRKSEPAAPLKG